MGSHTNHDHTHSSDGSCCSTQAKLGASFVIRDPVCGMTVDPNAEKPTAEHAAHMYHFCSQGCRTKFVASPESFLTATDPVCGMNVERASAQHFLRHEGKGFYFCSAGCKAKFEAEPAKYLGDRPALEPMPKGTQYTCPMHPEIVRDKPGSCPICGMALEPMGVPTGDEGPNPELIDFTRQALGKRPVVHPASVAHHGADGRRAVPRLARRPDGRVGSSWCWPRRSCCGQRSPFSIVAGSRSSTAAPICGR